MTLDDWRDVLVYWQSLGKDIAHLAVPPDIFEKLMTDEEPSNPTAENEPKWKRKRYFDGLTCGYSDCDSAADGYVNGIKPTKGGVGRLWYGPACIPCIRKFHDSLLPVTLAQLAQQRNGASDLANILDIEVGDLLKRLVIAGIDEKGHPLPAPTEEQAASWAAQGNPGLTDRTQHMDPRQQELALTQPPAETPGSLIARTAPVPLAAIEQAAQNAKAAIVQWTPYAIVDQLGMDYAANALKQVKGLWKLLDEQRLELGRPLRDKLEEIQTFFKVGLDPLKLLETTIKTRITEGSLRLAATRQAAFEAAQAALQVGNMGGAALATQQAVAADVVMPQGVSQRPVIRWQLQDPTQLPSDLWSWAPDANKIQAAVDAGVRQIPGVYIWEDGIVTVRT